MDYLKEKRSESTMRLGCGKCNKMLGDDVNGNLYIMPSTDLDTSRFKKKPLTLIEIKCNRCHLFNIIFGLTS